MGLIFPVVCVLAGHAGMGTTYGVYTRNVVSRFVEGWREDRPPMWWPRDSWALAALVAWWWVAADAGWGSTTGNAVTVAAVAGHVLSGLPVRLVLGRRPG